LNLVLKAAPTRKKHGKAERSRKSANSSKARRSAPSARPVASRQATLSNKPDRPLSATAAALAERLKLWRLDEAREMNVPAFFVLGNKTLQAIAAESPRTVDDLMAISGVGPSKAEKFGKAICRICAES